MWETHRDHSRSRPLPPSQQQKRPGQPDSSGSPVRRRAQQRALWLCKKAKKNQKNRLERRPAPARASARPLRFPMRPSSDSLRRERTLPIGSQRTESTTTPTRPRQGGCRGRGARPEAGSSPSSVGRHAAHKLGRIWATSSSLAPRARYVRNAHVIPCCLNTRLFPG